MKFQFYRRFLGYTLVILIINLCIFSLIKAVFSGISFPEFSYHRVISSDFVDSAIRRFYIDFENASSDMSASSSNYTMRAMIAAVSLFPYIMIFVLSIKNRHQAYLCFTVNVLGNFWLFLQIDDLPDEAYVWGSKVDNFLKDGHLGVNLFDGTSAESTVGTLHFVLASFFRYFGFTIEQSLIIPIFISLTFALSLVSYRISVTERRPLLGVIIISFFYLSTALGGNVAYGFDNVILLSALLTWFMVERYSSKQDSGLLRFFMAGVLPIIRLDMILCTIFVLLWEIRKIHLLGRLHVRSYIKSNLHSYSLFSVIILLFALYKYWAFGTLIPAMAKYKSFHPSSLLIHDGIIYVFKALSANYLGPTILFLLVLDFSLKRYARRSINLDNKERFHLTLLLFLFASSVLSSVFAGGDYFEPYLNRYLFPYLMTFFIVMLFGALRTERSSLIHLNQKFGSYVALIITGLIAFQPYAVGARLGDTLSDIRRVDFGRASCDALAAQAISKIAPNILPSASRRSIVVITPEVNGFAYHGKFLLMDLIGLVDSRISHDSTIGTGLHKFRIEYKNIDLNKANILWLYNSVECGFSPSLDDQYQIRFSRILNEFPGNFRIKDYRQYQTLGFTPGVIEFKSNIEKHDIYGQAYFFYHDN